MTRLIVDAKLSESENGPLVPLGSTFFITITEKSDGSIKAITFSRASVGGPEKNYKKFNNIN